VLAFERIGAHNGAGLRARRLRGAWYSPQAWWWPFAVVVQIAIFKRCTRKMRAIRDPQDPAYPSGGPTAISARAPRLEHKTNTAEQFGGRYLRGVLPPKNLQNPVSFL
jgi:hypothetical protein